jgi:hypothetical protein
MFPVGKMLCDGSLLSSFYYFTKYNTTNFDADARGLKLSGPQSLPAFSIRGCMVDFSITSPFIQQWPFEWFLVDFRKSF